MSTIADRLQHTRERLAEACHRAGRDPADVQLVAVSKTHPIDAIRDAQIAGQLHFGENYAQELRDKAAEEPDLSWHYIGQIQSNKARFIAPHAVRVHALDTVSHARALAKRATRPLHCLVSVNVGDEDSKGGVPPDRAIDRCHELAQVEGIEIVGLMCLPPYTADPEASAPAFASLASLAEVGRSQGLALTELSMGMSHDFHVAVRYGATWVRVGAAIFGPRRTRATG